MNRRLFNFKPQASDHIRFSTIAFPLYSVLDRMSTNRFSAIYYQSLKLPCCHLGSDTGCHIHVRKENIVSAKICPRPPYKRPQQLIFNENDWVMQYWSVAVICQKMSRAYWGQLRQYLGPVFTICSRSAYFSCLSKCHIVCMFFSPLNTKPSAMATGQTIRVGSLEHIS